MLNEYSIDTGSIIDTQAVSEKIRFYTNGYPFWSVGYASG